MVKKKTNKKLLYLFILNIIIVGCIFVTAYAFSNYTENAREKYINERLYYIREKLFALDTTELSVEERQKQIYSISYSIELLNTKLREYYASEMITEQFYKESDEKLVTLSALLLKTVQIDFSNKTLIYFFCENRNSECDYESFVLSYLSKKYGHNIYITGFDIHSEHPLVRLMKIKYEIKNVPFLIIGDKVINGFVSAKELEEAIEKYGNNNPQIRT